jgi:hypothetical protein
LDGLPPLSMTVPILGMVFHFVLSIDSITDRQFP